MQLFRYLKNHKAGYAINVTGLAVGVAVFILLIGWVRHELSYDQFHEHGRYIYRPSMMINFAGFKKNISRSQSSLMPWLLKNFPQIEAGTRLINSSRVNPFFVKNGDRTFEERKFYYADSTFLSVFSFELLKGNPATVLREPNSVVLTQTTAKRYFGDDDPIGKAIDVNDEGEYIITGLLKDIPDNSLLRPDFLASFSSLPVSRDASWGPAFYETYLVLQPDADVVAIEGKTNVMVAELFKNETSSAGDYVKYNFMPFHNLYLTSAVQEGETTGSIQNVYLFGAIALIVLLATIFNYVNMSITLAADRAKEIVLKKISGASRLLLVGQIMIESAISTGIAFVAALVIVYFSLQKFNEIASKNFDISFFFDGFSFISLALLFILVVVLVGLYPAFVITAFEPVSVLKGRAGTRSKSKILRKVLLGIQLTASVGLVAGALLIVMQMDFVRGREAGYDKDHVLILPYDKKTADVFRQFRTEVIKAGAVTSVGRSTESPVKISSAVSVNIEGEGAVRQVLVNVMAVDSAFTSTLKIPIVEGHNFSAADVLVAKDDATFHFLINESAAREIFPGKREVIGLRIDMDGLVGEVVGVMKDFNFASLHQAVGPLVLYPDEKNFNWIYLSMESDQMQISMRKVADIYNSMLPHRPFEYHFLDEQYDAQYASEDRVSTVSNLLSILTVIISSLGLMSLAAFSIHQRMKELSIRTVLGATWRNLMLVIFSDFVWVVTVAIVAGCSIAFGLGRQWLNTFAYKVDIGIFPFMVSAGACLGLLATLILYHTLRVYRSNPMKVLSAD